MKGRPGPSVDSLEEPCSQQEAEAILREMAQAIATNAAERPSELDRTKAHVALRFAAEPASSAAAPAYELDEGTFRRLVELAPDPLVMVDPNGTIVLVNSQAEKLFGYRRDEMLGHPVELIVPEGSRFAQLVDCDLPAGQPAVRPAKSRLELSGIRKDGLGVPLEISVTPIETERGQLLSATLRDITDRKRLEARYGTLVEGIPAVTFMAALDEGNSEFYVSPQIEEMLGFSQAEWLGDPFLWHRQLHPDDRQRWGEEFARTCASGVNFRSEYRFLSRDNREVWVHGEARVVRDELGQPLFLQGIAFDITESKRAEAALRRSAEELERKVGERTADLQDASLRAEMASRARASFLANMSHEIRTPLNGIIGFADLLRRGDASDESERAEWLEIIHSSGKHLLALINDILDLSKIDAGKLSVELLRCSPSQIIDEACAILRSKAEEKGLKLEAVYDGLLPETILTDPTRLRQILMNVAGNAIKFTPAGHVRITARLECTSGNSAGAASSKLAVTVSDTGIGIPADKLQMIFDPFTQADSSVTREYGGTGLGLPISRRLTEQLGGEVTVQSEVGRGTAFTCRIDTGPLDGVSLIEHRGPIAKPIEAAGSRAVPRVLQHRVLVVDDGDTNRKLVKLVLGRAGARVEQAENGQQAVDRATSESFDVILMDMQMPVLDGYAATRELRARGVTIPIIAMTANAMKGDDLKCREAGCSGYLAKPIDQDLLISAVAGIVIGEETRDDDGGQRSAPVKPASGPSAVSPFAAGPARSERSTVAAVPASALPGSAARADKLVSTLPTDDEDFREIVEQFVGRLREKITAMHLAWAAGDLPELAGLGHWLKGTSGTVGFRDFIKTAEQLERQAQSGRLEGIEDLITQLEQLAGRIAVE